MTTDLPLVTCIMPTRNRSRFVARAIELFVAQDYPNKRLVVFENQRPKTEHGVWGATFDHVNAARSKGVPIDCAYTHRQETIGQARNYACFYGHQRSCPICYNGPEYGMLAWKKFYAHAGHTCERDGLIAHWDDDDWHSPYRLSMQVKAMREQGARLCGLDRLVFYNGERAWLFQTPRKPWLAGGTLMYERSLWQEQPFLEVSDGEDTAFVDAAVSRGIKVATLTDESLYVAMLHDANTTKRDVSRLGGSYDVDKVRRWIGDDNART